MSDLTLSIIGVVWAGFSAWLIVRTVNRRERWAKRTLVTLIAMLILYPLSIGPVYWLRDRNMLPPWVLNSRIFAPIGRAFTNAPAPIQGAIRWYQELWSPPSN